MSVPLRRPQECKGSSLIEFPLQSGRKYSSHRLFLSLIFIAVLLLVFNPLDAMRGQLPFFDSVLNETRQGILGLQRGVTAVFSQVLLEDEMTALQNENARLRFALEKKTLPQDSSFFSASSFEHERTIHPARVVGLLPDFPSQILWLRGENDAAFEEGAAVLAFSGDEFVLVGRVENIHGSECYARLLSDPQTSVAVQIEDVAGVFLLEGNAPNTTAPYRLHYVTRDLSLRLGQRIFTAPQSDLFPGGLALGTISSIPPSGDGLFVEVFAAPLADPFSASRLFVVSSAPSNAAAFAGEKK